MQFADGRYDPSSPDSAWVNANDREMYQRTFQQGTREEVLQAQALMCALPSTPNDEIRYEMTAPMDPPVYGAMSQQPTINDIFAGNYSQSGNLNDRAPTDFSGTTAGVESTSIPSLPYWS